MLYIIFTLAVLILGFVTIICCMFFSMLSREEERKMKVDYDSNYS
jgi:protein-S-isoprenylcysteine O-methyltransferase Ste14